MQHLQSSLILGTKMTHPEDEYFLKEQCKELVSCVNNNNTKQLKTLIEKGLDPDCCEFKHTSILSYAIQKRKHDIVLTLLSHGSDLYSKDCFYKRPLDYAIETKDKHLINMIKRYYNAFPQKENTEHEGFNEVNDIYEATISGNLHAVVYFHNQGESLYQIKSHGTTLLHLSIEGNNPKLLIYLLNKGFNIDQADKGGTSSLMMAAMDTSRFALLKILVERKATLDQRNNRHLSALTMAIKRSNIQAARYLIEMGADVNIRDSIDTPLSLVHKALNEAIDPSLKNDLRELQTLLLIKGAHVNASDDNLQWSPLMLTASQYQDQKSKEQIRLLIKLGANINQVDKNKRSSLMIAASLGRIEAMEQLIKHNCSLNTFDKFGWTALMLAIYYNQKKAVQTLLQSGADVNIASKKGLTALRVAIDNERTALIPLLKEYGAVFPKE